MFAKGGGTAEVEGRTLESDLQDKIAGLTDEVDLLPSIFPDSSSPAASPSSRGASCN